MEKFDNSLIDTSFPIKTQALPTQKILIQKLRQPKEQDDIPENAFSSREDIQINKTLTQKPFPSSGLPSPRKSKIIENFFIFGVKRFLRKSAQDRFIKHTRRASNNLRITDLNALQQEVVLTLLNIQKQSQNIFTRIPIFESTNPLLILYDSVYLITILFSFFWLPYEVSFAPNYNHIFLTLNIFLLILIFLDSILLLHRSMVYKGRIVTDKMKILQLQGKIKLPFGLLQFICLVAQNLVEQIFIRETLVILFMIFVVPRLKMAINACANFFNFGVKVRDILSLGKMIFYLIHIVHMIACIWHLIGAYNSTSGQTWLEHYRYQNVSSVYKYTVSFYWAAMTMTTVGYGDITPQNQQEYAFANIVMVVACIVFAYTMNRIGTLLTNIDQRHSEFRQIFDKVRQNKELFDIYLKKNKVGHKLQSKIQSYLEYLSNVEDEKNVTVVNNMMTKLTDQLRLELQQNIRGSLIENCKSLSGFSRELKTELCSLVQEVCVPPNEEVLDPLKQDDLSLYLIQEGQVQFFPHLQKKINHLLISTGGSFGEISFFTGQPRTLKINTTKLCIFQKISQEDFLNLLDKYPQDKEYYFYIRDNLMYRLNYKLIDLQCLCCQNEQHMISNCPYLKLYINKERIIKAHLFPAINNSSQFPRAGKRRIHALTNYKLSQQISNTDWKILKNENEDDIKSFDSQQSESEDQDQVLLHQSAQEQYVHARTSLKKRFSNQITITDTLGRRRTSNIPEISEYIAQKSNNLSQRPSRESRLTHHDSLFKIKPLITEDSKLTPDTDGIPAFNQSPINSVNQSYGGYTSNYQHGIEFQLIKEFDILMNFTKFYPEHNIENVIQKLYPKDIMKVSRRSKIQTFSKYTFDYELAKKYLTPKTIRRKSKKQQSRSKNDTKMVESRH